MKRRKKEIWILKYQTRFKNRIDNEKIVLAKEEIKSLHQVFCEILFSSFFQETTEEDIREFFSPFGEIKRINLVMDRETNRSKGFCFVVFSTEISANLALENKTALIKGKRVDIKKAVQSSAKPTIPYVFPQLGFDHKWAFF